MRALQKFFLLSALALLIAACGNISNQTDLVGRYVCVHSFGIEILDLRKDGTYLQAVLIDRQPRPLANSGRWSFDAPGAALKLDSALLVTDGFGRLESFIDQPRVGTWVVPVESRFGKAVLRPNPDDEAAFHRL